MATIVIELTDQTIAINQDLGIDMTHLPYGAVGYRFNGSSEASPDILTAYWDFIDQYFAEHNIPKEKYKTITRSAAGSSIYGINQ